MDEKGLGRLLQSKRRAAGLTQQDLCHKANLSYSTLAKIERGAIKSPSIFTITSIAQAVGVSVDELLGLRTQPPAKVRHKSKSGVSFVYFDVNGCLVRFYHRAFTKLAHISGQSPDIVESTFWHYNDQICRGKLSLDDFNQILARNLKLKSVDWQKYYLEAIEPMPHMKELVRWVSELFGVGMMSNMMPGLLKILISQKIVPDIHYDAIIDSSVVHVIKPEVEIYRKASTQARSDNKEILLIDDSLSNLMAAEKLGWHVLWFDNYRPEESIKRIKDSLALS